MLIYRLAVGAGADGSFNVQAAMPAFALVVFGSVVAGWLLARPVAMVTARIKDAPSAVILQFVSTFAVWLAAERLGLSGVVTIVVFGLTLAQGNIPPMTARLRVATFAIWETVTVVLNVLAFTLIGLQLRPILEALPAAELMRALGAATVILAVVIAVRLVWAMTHHAIVTIQIRLTGYRPVRSSAAPPTAKSALVVGWSGMRGIVTLAAAMALPAGFPDRDFIQLTAFVVVLGTLVLQGLTLRPLLLLLGLPKDSIIANELRLARETGLNAAMAALAGDASAAAARLRQQYTEALGQARSGGDPRNAPDSILRRRLVDASRNAIEDLRSSGAIGDDAYRRAEEELDWLELSTQPVKDFA